jgi:hypothetical protein
VLDADMIAAQVGQVAPTPSLSTHSCRWGPAPPSISVPFAAVSFAIGTADPPSTATRETLGGHTSAVSGTALQCMVETTLGPAPPAQGQSELVTLYVQAPGKLACDSVRALANAAWPKLPPA